MLFPKYIYITHPWGGLIEKSGERLKGARRISFIFRRTTAGSS